MHFLKPLFTKLVTFLKRIKKRFILNDSHKAIISKQAIIEGDYKQIILGDGTIIEPGAVLSTKFGGKIILGNNCIVHRGAMLLTYGGNIELGDFCGVNPYSILYGHGGLKIGDFVRIAAHCVIIPANHGIDDLSSPIYEQPLSKKGITIGNDIWIGAGVRILDGVNIGDGSVIGAGTVVTKDIIPLSVNVGVPSHIIKMRNNKYRNEIDKILSDKTLPSYYDSIELFQELQKKYPPLPEYGYDSYSTWKRGVERTTYLFHEFSFLHETPKKVLDFGCGDGMVGFIISKYGHNVSLVDIADWRDSRAKNLQFIQIESEKLPISDQSYDFVYSYNTFEHVKDPKETLFELIRVCKRGGYIFLEFGPLYSSPWGLHAYRTLLMPYPQFLFSNHFITERLNEYGIYDLGKKLTGLQPLNKWRVNQFDDLWRNSFCKVISNTDFIIADSFTDLIIKFPKAFTGRKLSYRDLTTQGLRIILQKE